MCWCRLDFYRYSQLRVSRTVLVSTHFPVFVIPIMNHPPRNVKFPFVSSQRFPSTQVIKTSTSQKRTQETRYNDCKAFPKPLTQNLISVFVSRQCRWSHSWTKIIMEFNRFCCLLVFMINLQTIFGEDDTITHHRSKRQAFSPDVRFFLNIVYMVFVRQEFKYFLCVWRAFK